MKKILVITLSALMIVSCAPTTKITAHWVKQSKIQKQYGSFLVVTLSGNAAAKTLLEKDMSAELAKRGCQVLKGSDEIPVIFSQDSIKRSQIVRVVQEKNLDAILTIAVLKAENDFRYVPGFYECYNPMLHMHYHHFHGYYNYWSPCVYNAGYYQKTESYFLETNIYDGKSEELIWSAQSHTYFPASLQTVSKDYSRMIVEHLINDKLINQKSASNQTVRVD